MQLRNNKGFTLIEIAIVLTIVGLIIGGIWLAASTVFNNQKAQRLQQDVIQVIQNTKTLFAGQGAAAVTTGFNATVGQQAGIFPPDMLTATVGTLVTPFSVDPTVAAVTVTAPTPTTVNYIFGAASPNGLPSSACTQLLTTLGGSNNISKLGISALSAGANGTTAVALPAAGSSLSAATAAGACANTGNGNAVGVTFSAI